MKNRRGGRFPEQARMAKLTVDQDCRHQSRWIWP